MSRRFLYVEPAPDARYQRGPVRQVIATARSIQGTVIGTNLTLACGHTIFRRVTGYYLPKTSHCPLCSHNGLGQPAR